MREIKFRAWHDGKSSFQYEPKMIYDENPGDCLVWKNQRQPLTIMQYTGLKDKNEVDIYEGDIVEANGDKYLIEWGSDHPGFCMTLYKPYGKLSSYDIDDLTDYEIIGNIYANHEMLEATP